MRAVNHLHEHYKASLRSYIANRSSVVIDKSFYINAKCSLGMSKSNVDKILNELVNAGEIVLEGAKYFALTAKLVKRSEVAE